MPVVGFRRSSRVEGFARLYLGTVSARDESSAEAAAVEEFGIDERQRGRLVVCEQGLPFFTAYAEASA